MDLKALAAALMGSVNNAPNFGANINDTASNGAELQNIRNLGGLEAQGTAGKRAVGALGDASSEAASQEAARAKAAAQAAADEEARKQKELERLQNPKNYSSKINEAGGYDFYDPLGNKISAVEYARKKNMQLTDVYKDSQDPNDKEFLADYDKVTQLGKILQSGDKDARDKFYKKNPDYKKAYENVPYAEIVTDLHKEYPGYFRSEQRSTNDLATAARTPAQTGLTDEELRKQSARNALGGNWLSKRIGDLLGR